MPAVAVTRLLSDGREGVHICEDPDGDHSTCYQAFADAVGSTPQEKADDLTSTANAYLGGVITVDIRPDGEVGYTLSVVWS